MIQYVAPLLQTLLWVLLISGALWRFNRPLYDILTAIGRRIGDANSIKAGPFEFSGQLKSQDENQQRERTEQEATELLATPTDQSPEVLATQIENARARVLLAEDLALRAVQAEYRVPMLRQVTAGSDSGFDAVMLDRHRMTVVEVKYASGVLNVERIHERIMSLDRSIQNYSWPGSGIILAIVFEQEDQKDESRHLDYLARATASAFNLKVYSIGELERKFGVELR